MPGPYIPASDADFDAWIVNFSTLLTADPTAYGEDAASALVVQTAADTWTAAYLAATDPGTRTTPTIAAKDAARVDADAAARPVAQRINANTSVTNMQREDLGITVRKTTRTPVPAPITAPALTLRSAIPNQHELSIRDETTPTTKAKPFGVVGVELHRAIGVAPAVDPAATSFLNVTTKTPTWQQTDPGDAGSTVTYFARWITRSGPGGEAQRGPWSAPLSFIAM